MPCVFTRLQNIYNVDKTKVMCMIKFVDLIEIKKQEARTKSLIMLETT